MCLGNSLTHQFSDGERRQALLEFSAALHHNGILIIGHAIIIEQRNYDAILDNGFSCRHFYYYCGENVKVGPEYKVYRRWIGEVSLPVSRPVSVSFPEVSTVKSLGAVFNWLGVDW